MVKPILAVPNVKKLLRPRIQIVSLFLPPLTLGCLLASRQGNSFTLL